MLNSNRKFALAFIEGKEPQTCKETLEEILIDNNSEYRYAMQENIDPILDLKVGEQLVMQFNRDNKNSWGVIERIE